MVKEMRRVLDAVASSQSQFWLFPYLPKFSPLEIKTGVSVTATFTLPLQAPRTVGPAVGAGVRRSLVGTAVGADVGARVPPNDVIVALKPEERLLDC